MLESIHDFSRFATIIALIALVGWIADQTLSDVRQLKRDWRRRHH